jgi:hypothetical protein
VHLGSAPSRDTLQLACDGLVAPLTAWLQSHDSCISGNASLTWVKLNWVLATGLQRDTNTVQSEIGPFVTGLENQGGTPFYLTYAITLRTRLRRGRGHAGRVFPPAVRCTAPNGDPYEPLAKVNTMATKFIELLNAARAVMQAAFILETPGSLAPDPAVVSPGDTETGAIATWEPIISAVVDRVPDVQHRRTRQVPRSEGTTVLLDP